MEVAVKTPTKVRTITLAGLAVAAVAFAIIGGRQLVNSPAAITPSANACGFYNEVVLEDKTGDATPGAPAYVDIKKVTLRQIQDQVQIAWEGGGPLANNDHQYFFLFFDTDHNPATGHHWRSSAIGAEFKISISQDATLGYFDPAGELISEEHVPVEFSGNTVYLNVPFNKIPAATFSLYAETSGDTPYRDVLDEASVVLSPSRAAAALHLQSTTNFFLTNPPTSYIANPGEAIRLKPYFQVGSRQIVLDPSVVTYSITHPVAPRDPSVGDPSSIISITNDRATYLREGFVFVQAHACHFASSDTLIVVTGSPAANSNQNVVPIFPRSYTPVGAVSTFGEMLSHYPRYAATVNEAYRITQKLYGGFRPFHGATQIFALLVKLDGSQSGGNNNPLETTPCGYMNCGDGSPDYNTVIHEMGHNFGQAKAAWDLMMAHDSRVGRVFGECLASLPVHYVAHSYVGPGVLRPFSVPRSSFEYTYFSSFLTRDLADNQRTFSNFEDFIHQGKIQGIFDLDALPPEEREQYRLDPVSVGCSLFINPAMTPDRFNNQYGWGLYERFLKILGDHPLPQFDESKVETYFSAIYSVSMGTDMRDKLRFWGFTIDDTYYDQILPAIRGLL